jgi:precorrin-3B synthase
LVTRSRARDACPGALQLHRAADGALARIRLPGGMVDPAQLDALARAATRFGSPAMELTARGNIQIRGIRDDGAAAALADAVAAAGLLPSATHERVRNIVASPLSGRVGDRADVREWVRLLDASICAEPALAGLPGRFWFGIDDGRGDVSGLGADVGVHACGDAVAVLAAGRDTGVRIAPSDVVVTLTSIARRFVEARGTAWRMAELADTSVLLEDLPRSAEPTATWPPVIRPPVGWIAQDDGRIALGAAVPLGVLLARVAEYLAAIDAPMIITPWRSVLVCDLGAGVADAALRVLAPMGLVFDDTSPWLDVSACTGSPGCEHSAADVRADAARAVTDAGTQHRHFVGCDRACGSPPAGEVLIATGDGYRLRSASP